MEHRLFSSLLVRLHINVNDGRALMIIPCLMHVFSRSAFPNEEVLGWAWNNVWEWGQGSRAYKLANDGYQVWRSPGYPITFLY